MPRTRAERWKATATLAHIGVAAGYLRKTSGLSAGALAQKVGVHRNTIMKIELGMENMTVSTLLALSEALGVEPADLMPRKAARRKRGR